MIRAREYLLRVKRIVSVKISMKILGSYDFSQRKFDIK